MSRHTNRLRSREESKPEPRATSATRNGIVQTGEVVVQHPFSSAFVTFFLGCVAGLATAMLLFPRRREPTWSTRASRWGESLAHAPESLASRFSRR